MLVEKSLAQFLFTLLFFALFATAYTQNMIYPRSQYLKDIERKTNSVFIQTPPPIYDAQQSEMFSNELSQNQAPITDPLLLSNDNNYINQYLTEHQFPQSNYNQNQNEEVVFVPTPVDPKIFEQLKSQKDKKIVSPRFLEKIVPVQHKNNINQALVDDKYLEVLMKNNSMLQAQAFEDVVNSKTNDQAKVEKLITLQEKDYDKYFDAINKMEYNKIYSSLNKKDMNSVYDLMSKKENEVDFGKYALEASQPLNPQKFFSGADNQTAVIDLPFDKENAISMFGGLYNKSLTDSDLKQELEKISLMQTKDKDKYPMVEMKGTTDSKVRPLDIKVIGINDKDKNSKRKTSDDIMDEKLASNYPSFRSVYPFEKKDAKYRQMMQLKKEADLKKLKKEINLQNKDVLNNKPVSFAEKKSIIEIPDQLQGPGLSIVELARKSVKERNDQIRGELINCKMSCDGSCKRIQLFKKNESEETCKLKCYLACTNNSLNKLLKN